MDYSSSSQPQLNQPIIQEPDDTPQHSQLVRPEIGKHQSSFEQFQMRSEPNGGKIHELVAEMASLRAVLNSLNHKSDLLWNHLANLEQHNQTLLMEDAKNNKKLIS